MVAPVGSSRAEATWHQEMAAAPPRCRQHRH